MMGAFARTRPRLAAEQDEVTPVAPDMAQIEPVHYLPDRPMPFLWFFVKQGYLGRYIFVSTMLALGMTCDALDPYLLKQLLTALPEDTARGYPTAATLVPLAILVALWFGATTFYRITQ